MNLTLFGFEMNLKKLNDFDDKPAEIELAKDGAHVVKGISGAESNSFTDVKESELIAAYRQVSHSPEVSSAIDEIINEVVITDSDEAAVKVDLTRALDAKQVDEGQAEEIKEAFEKIYKMLDFTNNGYELFREWYVDSRVAFAKTFHKDTSKGLRTLTKLDPRKLKRIKVVDEDDDMMKVIDDFFVYTRSSDTAAFGTTSVIRMTGSDFLDAQKSVAFKLNPAAVSYITSGLVDKDSNITYGHLHKAVKVANMLDMMESAVLIHRMSRAHDVRAVYVSTGNLPPAKAKAKVEAIKAKYQRKTKFDTVRGTLTSNPRTMDLSEEFYIGRDGDNRATEISSIASSAGQTNLDDVESLRDKLYSALNVPIGRFREASAIFGNQSEITREELKFHRFISRLRLRFSMLFKDLLKTELIVTRVMTWHEWQDLEPLLDFDFARDNFFAEVKELEIMSMRIAAADEASQFAGKYISHKTIREKFLNQSVDEINNEDKQMKAESSDPRFKPEE